MLRMNELFSGIGSQTKALQRAGVDHVITGISEIDEPAIISYTAIYGDIYNYGDISKVDSLKQADFWTYSFPCTDISKAGKMEGITESTRSGLILQVERLLREAHEKGELPMYLMLENVATLASKRFKGFLDGWIQFLSDLGYDTKYKVINASTQGIPQNRDRIIAVSKLRAGGGLHNFEFPQNIPLRVSLDEIMEKNVDDRYYVDLEKYKDIISIVNGKIRVRQATKQGYIEMDPCGICDVSYPTSKTRRGRIQGGGKICPTLTASVQGLLYFDEEYRARQLTGLENWRLMGFDDRDYFLAKEAGVSEAQLIKQAGNSIVVDVLERVFINLFK